MAPIFLPCFCGSQGQRPCRKIKLFLLLGSLRATEESAVLVAARVFFPFLLLEDEIISKDVRNLFQGSKNGAAGSNSCGLIKRFSAFKAFPEPGEIRHDTFGKALPLQLRQRFLPGHGHLFLGFGLLRTSTGLVLPDDLRNLLRRQFADGIMAAVRHFSTGTAATAVPFLSFYTPYRCRRLLLSPRGPLNWLGGPGLKSGTLVMRAVKNPPEEA